MRSQRGAQAALCGRGGVAALRSWSLAAIVPRPATTWLVDPFSSGISFPDWQELEGSAVMWPIRATYDPLVVFQPRSWLLRAAWKRHGAISARGGFDGCCKG